MPSNTPETQSLLPVTPKLLPCPNPWCSGRTKPRIFENICGTSWSVECAECDILCTFAASPEDAANNWNSRRSSNGAARILADLTANCEHCDGTGDVHSIDGEWRGRCHCAAALTPSALSGDNSQSSSNAGGVGDPDARALEACPILDNERLDRDVGLARSCWRNGYKAALASLSTPTAEPISEPTRRMEQTLGAKFQSATAEPMAELQRLGQEYDGEAVEGPFHVSRSSDGERHWFSARDPAACVTIPAKDRNDAYALVASLNRSCTAFARRERSAPTPDHIGKDAVREAAQAVIDEAARMTMTMRRRKIFDALARALSATPAQEGEV